MDIETARELTAAYRQSCTLINDTLYKAMQLMPEDEYKLYRRTVGKALWEMYESVGLLIFERFPELDPHIEKVEE